MRQAVHAILTLTPTLVADATGRAKLVRKDVSCEGVMRTFRKTTMLVDTAWGVISVRAPGYLPLEECWLADVRYDDKGYSQSEKLQRIEFKIELARRK